MIRQPSEVRCHAPLLFRRMARVARAVVPGLPHHVTQRGNRRQATFFVRSDYELYMSLMAHWCAKYAVDIWAYCLMPNHTHLIAVPPSAQALRIAIGETHRAYTAEINAREGWQGYLWQGRFASFAMDEAHTLAAARYIELNPVQAGLVAHAEDYEWSSARAHLLGRDDGLVVVRPLLARVAEWSAFLRQAPTSAISEDLRRHATSGRPLGDEVFVTGLESLLGRALRARPRGRPRSAGS
jgi:putative transposase